jgi:hypothetical protein
MVKKFVTPAPQSQLYKCDQTILGNHVDSIGHLGLEVAHTSDPAYLSQTSRFSMSPVAGGLAIASIPLHLITSWPLDDHEPGHLLHTPVHQVWLIRRSFFGRNTAYFNVRGNVRIYVAGDDSPGMKEPSLGRMDELCGDPDCDI